MDLKWVITMPVNMWSSTNPRILVPAIKAATSLMANQQARALFLSEFEPLRFEADFELLQLTADDSEVWETDPQ